MPGTSWKWRTRDVVAAHSNLYTSAYGGSLPNLGLHRTAGQRATAQRKVANVPPHAGLLARERDTVIVAARCGGYAVTNVRIDASLAVPPLCGLWTY